MKIFTREQYRREKSNVPGVSHAELDDDVLNIISRVRAEGDQALKNFTEQFDQVTIEELRVTDAEFEEAETLVSAQFKKALRTAKKNITSFRSEERRVGKEYKFT